MVKVRKDLTGMVFGKLTVLKQADDYIYPDGTHAAQWLCECSCTEHTRCIVPGGNLTQRRTTSCGCYSRELASKRLTEAARKTNRYDLSGEYGIGYTSQNKEFYFDLEDYDKIKDYCWYIHNGYVETIINKNIVRMHRIIMDVEDSLLKVDHIKHKKNDNRKSQLRVVSCSQNSENKKIHSNNTSGTTGVSFNKRTNKWDAYIIINYKTINLGSFKNLDDAINSRKLAEEKYFGEYSYDNSMNMEE